MAFGIDQVVETGCGHRVGADQSSCGHGRLSTDCFQSSKRPLPTLLAVLKNMAVPTRPCFPPLASAHFTRPSYSSPYLRPSILPLCAKSTSNLNAMSTRMTASTMTSFPMWAPVTSQSYVPPLAYLPRRRLVHTPPAISMLPTKAFRQ